MNKQMMMMMINGWKVEGGVADNENGWMNE